MVHMGCMWLTESTSGTLGKKMSFCLVKEDKADVDQEIFLFHPKGRADWM